MRSGHGWKCAVLTQIPPLKSSFNPGWHSVRHYLGISAFGVNGVSSQAVGDELVPEHDEKQSDQEEMFFVCEGLVEIIIDGERCEAGPGVLVSVEPQCRRRVKALDHPTVLLIVGAPKRSAYQPPAWDKL